MVVTISFIMTVTGYGDANNIIIISVLCLYFILYYFMLFTVVCDFSEFFLRNAVLFCVTCFFLFWFYVFFCDS